LIITGSMGAGKSAVLAEASDILGLRLIAHAAIDLDSLGLAHLPSADHSDSVMYQNLQSISKNYESVGVTRLLLARAVEDRAELNLCCSAVEAKNLVICRLIASVETMQQRVKNRELGVLSQQFIDRVPILNGILDRARLDDFTVVNEDRSITEAAHEVLLRAGWISD
jgi:adenylylsulfate kinase